MTAHSKGKETDLLSGQARVKVEPDYSVLVGEDFSFTGISGRRYGDLNNLIQRIMRRNCDSVLQIATPHTSDLHKEVANLSGKIAADLEARMSRAARNSRRSNNSRGKECPKYLLDVLTTDILEWVGHQSSLSSESSRYKDNSETTRLEADYVSPLFEAFLLFVAHHINKHFTKRNATRLHISEDCRLILPIANKYVETEDSGTDSAYHFNPADYVNSAEFVNVECGVFPIRSTVERQPAPAPLLIFANAEIVRHKDNYNEAELRLTKKTKALLSNQHNRRFAWGLAVSSRSIHAYVFGPDDIWASTEMDISSVKGRRAFISLLVDWSLCSVDRLGFDPTIRYEIDPASSDPYLEIDVHNIDASTGQVDSHTYYSQQCVGAANRLTGRHARYFTASTSRESMDKPTFLIKDVWATLDSNSASSERESTFLNVLHAEFDESSEFGGRFSQIVSTGPVYISYGDIFIADLTATAFVGLPNVSQVRQHRRTVVQWAGKMISAADNPSQVVVEIANAMAALNAAYVKCKIFHGNISDRAILIQETTGGVKGVLADFDYASFAGDTGVEMPELRLFQSIHILENPGAIRMPLDDMESLLYLVCWLGTFGINQAERREFVVGPSLPILNWIRGTDADIANEKRNHMANENVFYDRILSHMDENSPLRPLALDIYRVLFNYPGSYGTARISDARLAQMEDPAIAAALRALPSINKKRDPYMVRNNFTDVIIQNLIDALDRHRAAALAVLDAGEADDGFKAAIPPCVGLSTKKHYTSKAALAGPSKRPRS